MRPLLRSLARSPGFTLSAAGILALGLGASTAIFSVVHALLLAPLKYRDGSALVQVVASHAQLGDAGLAPATFVDLAQGCDSFAASAAQYYYYVNVTGVETPALVNSGEVTPDFFNLLGVPALYGRTWTREETAASATPVVVLGHALWRSHFGGRVAVIGQQITLDDVVHTIIGVMPPSFKDPAGVAQLWRPMRAGRDNFLERGSHYFTAFARLKSGVTRAQANTELAGFAERLAQTYPQNYEGWTLRADDLRQRIVGNYRDGLLVVLGAVACVLLITCANVAGLHLVRAATRRKELAVRSALGATRAQIVQHLLAESLVLAAIGGVGGIILGSWIVDALLATIPEGWLPRADEIALNLPVLATAFALTAATGIAFGLAPAFGATRANAQDALKDQARGTAGPSARRLRSGLVVAEIALAVVLLTGAGLLGRSFVTLLRTDSGLDVQRVLTLTVSLSAKRYDTPAKCREFFSRAQTEVAAVPGVQAAGFTQTSPFRWGLPVAFAPVSGNENAAASGGDLPSAFLDSIGSDYFRAVGTPLLAGRAFSAADDAQARPVVIISRAAALRYFGSENPVGRFLVARDAPQTRLEIIGVAGDVRRVGLAADAPLQVYRPIAQRPPAFATLMVRTALAPAALTKSVEAALRRVDPDTPVSDVATMDALVSRSLTQPRITWTLLSAFAVLALVLSSVGLYGLVAYSVAQRTREFGIRSALGASPRDLLALVAREGALPIAAGVGLGLGGAFVVTRLLAAMLFQTSVHDPLVFVVVPLTLALVATLACLLPARRATRIDPLEALRAE